MLSHKPFAKRIYHRSIVAFVILTIVLAGNQCSRIAPYKLHAEMLPANCFMFYAGPYFSIIGDANDNFTNQKGYALQLGRLQFTYMKLVSSQ